MAEGGMMPGRYHQLCPRVAESAFFDGLSHTETSRDGEENGQVEALQNCFPVDNIQNNAEANSSEAKEHQLAEVQNRANNNDRQQQKCQPSSSLIHRASMAWRS